MKTTVKLFTLLMLAFPALLEAQVKFDSLSFSDALAKAKKESKTLMAYFTTSWCMPCKQMEQEFFPRKDVGDSLNKHFVIIKLDAEKGEGKMLAEKYFIGGYPTMVFFENEAEEIERCMGLFGDGFDEYMKVLLRRGKDNPSAIDREKRWKNSGTIVVIQKKDGQKVSGKVKEWKEGKYLVLQGAKKENYVKWYDVKTFELSK
jgi:thioredoxin-related protein